MSFINPIWLWGLTGLAIPAAIHLLSRKEGPVIRIGSIRFLTETSTSKFSSVRLNEVVLLAIRTLLIICVVLFLAGLLWSAKDSQTGRKWVVVESGLQQNNKLEPILDSLQKEGYELRTLANGFPTPSNDTTEKPDYFQLSEKLSKEPVDAIVFARNTLNNFKGKRTSLPANVRWIAWPDEHVVDSASSNNLKPVNVTIVYEATFGHDKKIMLAALKAIQTVVPDKIIIHELPAENYIPTGNSDYLIWLSKKSVSYPGKQLTLREDAISDLVIQENRTRWLLTKRLSEDNAVDKHLAIRLMDVLFDSQQARQLAGQQLTVPNEIAWSQTNSAHEPVTAATGIELDKVLICAAIVLFIIERILAFYRKQ